MHKPGPLVAYNGRPVAVLEQHLPIWWQEGGCFWVEEEGRRVVQVWAG